MIVDRRRFLAVAAGGMVASAAFPKPSLALNPPGRPLHGLSAFGDLKYPAGFAIFDYANADAPVGGVFNVQPWYWVYNQNVQAFNTLNTFVRRGDAPPRMEMCFDSLMASSHDEPDAVYGHVAETVTISGDGNRYTFALRDIARYHDGTPITADDVKFSYDTIRAEGHPELALPLRPLAEVVVEDARTVALVFDGTQSAQAILTIASAYPILSKAYYAERAFDEATLEPPLGSGPYRVGRFNAGGFIEFERVDDYWGRQIGTGAGQNHFRTIRIEFYAERQAGFEAFKKGEVTWRREFTSKTWATEYDFPAIEDGRVVRALFPVNRRPSMQAWTLNQRRERFRDRRVRDAIGLCFDFEWTNQKLFYGLYQRSQSLFSGSQYEATGLPDEAELALIARLGDEHAFPEGIMEPAYVQPAADGSGRDRARLREATGLLNAAGWTVGEGGLLRNAAGESLDVEFLIRASVFERIYGPFVEVMRMVGINAGLRLVDPAQYQARTTEFDFDMAGLAVSWTPTPTTNGLETLLGSASADVPGSRNWAGVADPLVDALIEEVGQARTRAEHETAMRVLDRVLRLRRDWIPNWTSANQFIAYWDMYGFDEQPDYYWPVEALWWFDEDKARAIGRA